MSLKPGKTLSGAVCRKETDKLMMFPHCYTDNNKTADQLFIDVVERILVITLTLTLLMRRDHTCVLFSIPEERFHMYLIPI